MGSGSCHRALLKAWCKGLIDHHMGSWGCCCTFRVEDLTSLRIHHQFCLFFGCLDCAKCCSGSQGSSTRFPWWGFEPSALHLSYCLQLGLVYTLSLRTIWARSSISHEYLGCFLQDWIFLQRWISTTRSSSVWSRPWSTFWAHLSRVFHQSMSLMGQWPGPPTAALCIEWRWRPQVLLSAPDTLIELSLWAPQLLCSASWPWPPSPCCSWGWQKHRFWALTKKLVFQDPKSLTHW